MKVLVSGARGFIGGRLVPRLMADGHDVLAMTRQPDDYDGPGQPVGADTGDADSLRDAMRGCTAAYYLVHGLGTDGDFAAQDADAARLFGEAAADNGVEQIIYLGGLGREGDDLSDHLASRQEVEGELSRAGVPVTALRAALVIGAGSASFELLRQLVRGLPVLGIPLRADRTTVQPIAMEDTARYLTGVLGLPAAVNATFEIGGPEVVTYADLLRTMAELMGRRRWSVPLLPTPPMVTRAAVGLLTDVDPQLAVTLLDSLGNDVVVTDDRIRSLVPGPLLDVRAMLTSALDES